jgi:hypothetical protein
LSTKLPFQQNLENRRKLPLISSIPSSSAHYEERA